MKHIIVLLALLVSSGAFSQSKKKQIELLQHQLDSLTSVNKELEEANNESIEVLKDENYVLRGILKKYILEIDKLNTLYLSLAEKNYELEEMLTAANAQKTQESTLNQTSKRKTNNLASPFENRNTKSTRYSNSNSISKSEDNSVKGRNLNLGRESGISTLRERLTNVSVDHIEIGEDAKITYSLTVDSDGNVVAFSCVTTATSTTNLELIDKIGGAIKEQVKYAKRVNTPSENKLFEVNIKANSLNSTTNSRNTSNNPFGSGGFAQDSGMETERVQEFGNTGRIRLNNVSVEGIEITEDATIYYKLTVDADGNVVAFSNMSTNTTTTDLTLINKIGVTIKKQVKYNKIEGAPLQYQFYTIHVKAN